MKFKKIIHSKLLENLLRCCCDVERHRSTQSSAIFANTYTATTDVNNNNDIVVVVVVAHASDRYATRRATARIAVGVRRACDAISSFS